ncbi:MAG: hypothetical protein ACLGIF_01925 [Actinomycetes bacterium]
MTRTTSLAPLAAPARPSTAPEPWTHRLERVRDALEAARQVLTERGWTSGAWFSVREPGGETRPVGTREALALRTQPSAVASACLVGTLLQLTDDPDTAHTVGDVWGCVDELYEALHERMGHDTWPPGHVFAPDQRRARLQGLTAWNDAPGRSQADVLDLLDRAVTRTVLGACRR